MEEGTESLSHHRKNNHSWLQTNRKKANTILVNFEKIQRNLTGQYYESCNRSISWNTCKLQLYFIKMQKTVVTETLFFPGFSITLLSCDHVTRKNERNSMITLSLYLLDVNTSTSPRRLLIAVRLPQIRCFSKFQGEARLKTGICNTSATTLITPAPLMTEDICRPRGRGHPSPRHC